MKSFMNSVGFNKSRNDIPINQKIIVADLL